MELTVGHWMAKFVLSMESRQRKLNMPHRMVISATLKLIKLAIKAKDFYVTILI